MDRILVNKLNEDDKHQHFWYSCVILLLLIAFLDWQYSLAGTIILGLMKEVWDYFRGSGFCWYDMFANGLGILLGLLIIAFWNFFSKWI